MKNIIINNDGLKKEEVQETVKKCRCIFLNSDKILIEKYAGLYMLPGGKIDQNEDALTAIIREIKEELGMDINVTNLTPFLIIEHYNKDYLKTNGKRLNKLTKTIYFISNIPYNIDLNKVSLTEKEKEGNLTIKEINTAELRRQLSFRKDMNHKIDLYSQELLEVLANLIIEKENIKQKGAIKLLLFNIFFISSYKNGLYSSIFIGLLLIIILKQAELTSSIIINNFNSGLLILILFSFMPFINISYIPILSLSIKSVNLSLYNPNERFLEINFNKDLFLVN